MNHPFERIHDPMTRKQLLRRAAVGGATPPPSRILAACGGDGGIEGQQAPTGGDTTVAQELADEITVSNWPFYIDQNDDASKFPTLEQFTKETGVKVNYLEDINSNEEFFGEIQALLSRGQGIDRDIIVLTAWLAARLLDLGYLQKLDKSAIPNIGQSRGHARELCLGPQPRLQPSGSPTSPASATTSRRSGRPRRSSSCSIRPSRAR